MSEIRLPDAIIETAADLLHLEVNLDVCDHCDACTYEHRDAPGPARECNGACSDTASKMLYAVLPEIQSLIGTENARLRAALAEIVASDDAATHAGYGLAEIARQALAGDA